jgi:hypothetical protein
MIEIKYKYAILKKQKSVFNEHRMNIMIIPVTERNPCLQAVSCGRQIGADVVELADTHPVYDPFNPAKHQADACRWMRERQRDNARWEVVTAAGQGDAERSCTR